MKTKYTFTQIWFWTLLVLAFLVGMLAIFASATPAGALGIFEQKITARPGGDCLADLYTGDVYKTFDDYCNPFPEIQRPNSSLNLSQNSEEISESENNNSPEISLTEVSTPAPEVIPTEVPTSEPEKECKNKNSGKDGTPSECNAGGGQEKNGG